MRNIVPIAATLSACLLLAACLGPREPLPPTDIQDETLKVQEQEPPPTTRETPNVSYAGVIKPAGISIYMEGTHRLVLPDGRFVLLQSDEVDLNGYVGESVDVVGAVRPTVEGDAMIMWVERVRLHRPSSAPSEAEEGEEGEEIEEIEEIPSSAPSEATEGRKEIEEDKDQKEEEPAAASEEDVVEPSPELSAKIAAMAEESLDASEWTQQYCTSHIGFCIPVHRNWWWKSFGTTTTAYWHVEIGPEEVKGLRDGPIVVNLVEGALSDLKKADGEVATKDRAVGYRLWTDNRHFEVEGAAELAGAVSYITENLRVYVPES